MAKLDLTNPYHGRSTPRRRGTEGKQRHQAGSPDPAGARGWPHRPGGTRQEAQREGIHEEQVGHQGGHDH